MADQYTPLPVKSKNTNDLSVQLRNPANSAFMGDNTTPLQVGDGGGSLTIDSPGVPTALGQSTMANSMRVVIASDQSSVPVTVGNASLAVTQSGTWNVGLTNDPSLVDNAGFTDGTTRVEMAGYIFDEVAGTALTENDAAAARIDSKRAQVLVLEDASTRGQRAAVSAAGRVSVDGSGVTQPVSGTVTANQGTAAAGSGAWPVSMTTTGDVVVKPGDSANNALRVNVVAGGGSTAPSSPQRSYLTISALAISTRTAMNFTEIGGAGAGAARLAQLEMASSVTCKWELFTVANATESGTPVMVFFTTSANPTLIWTAPHPNYVQITATAGADNFRLYATNLDNALAADVYATALWDLA
jgi:hypothetical protein